MNAALSPESGFVPEPPDVAAHSGRQGLQSRCGGCGESRLGLEVRAVVWNGMAAATKRVQEVTFTSCLPCS